MTSVASIAFSFGDNSDSADLPSMKGFATVVPCLGGRAVRDWVLEVPLEAVFVAAVLLCPCSLAVWESRSVKRVTVAGVHVDTEASAILTESALACGEVILRIKFV